MPKLEAARIEIPQPVLDRIARRVADAELGYAPDDDSDWRYGVDAGFLKRLQSYWRDRYDWREAESAFNAHEQVRCEIDGISVHAFRFRPPAAGARFPLILTHGWPGSPIEFMRAAPLLAEQGFDVIVPSLPGYGFSGRPARPIGPPEVASLWRKLMVDGFRFERFGAQGGDWGAAVTAALGHGHADVVQAIHLNMLNVPPPPQPSAGFADWKARIDDIRARESGYAHEHATKPQTIGLALADTPLGFAGWVIEKCRSWSDCGGDVEKTFGLDALITNVMTYLTTGNVQSGIWMYNGLGKRPFIAVPITVPTGFAAFPAEFMPPPPREDAAAHINLVHWTEMQRGGHFGAWEQPDAFAAEVGTFFRSVI